MFGEGYKGSESTLGLLDCQEFRFGDWRAAAGDRRSCRATVRAVVLAAHVRLSACRGRRRRAAVCRRRRSRAPLATRA